jgi:hypothetical protein
MRKLIALATLIALAIAAPVGLKISGYTVNYRDGNQAFVIPTIIPTRVTACAMPFGGGGYPCGAAACSSPGALDVLATNAWFAGEFRRTRMSYSGPIAKLRRNGDNATKDIFAAGCHFDTTTAATFCAGASSTACFVDTLYDQRTSPAFNFTQGTLANQPLYVASCRNAHPCMRMASASTQNLTASTGGVGATQANLTLLAVATVTTAGQLNGRIFSTDDGSLCDYTGGWTVIWDTNIGGQFASGSSLKNSGTYLAADDAASPALTNNAQITAWATTNATGTYGISVNQDAGGSVNGSSPATAFGTANAQIGGSTCGPAYLDGDVEALIVYSADDSAAGTRNPVAANLKAYWATP